MGVCLQKEGGINEPDQPDQRTPPLSRPLETGKSSKERAGYHQKRNVALRKDCRIYRYFPAYRRQSERDAERL